MSEKPRAFAPFEWMLCRRYLHARRKEGFISVIAGFSFLGIMLGVATLIIVMSVMNGFRTELLGKVLGFNGHITVVSLQGPLQNFDAVAERIRPVLGVKSVVPMVEGQAMASGPRGNSGVLVRGFRKQDISTLNGIGDSLRSGSLEAFASKNGVLIGARLARKLGVEVGDKLSLITPRGNVTPFGVTPRIKGYQVAAIYSIGMTEYDSGFVFMPLKESQLYFNKGKGVSALEIRLDDPDQAQEVRTNISKVVQAPVSISTWQEVNSSFFNALQVERNVMFLILTLIVLVAALNIVSGLIMLVKDKSSDIAILRTMGATRGAIMRIFFITGASIGVVGTLAGFVLGTVFCLYIEDIRQFLSSLSGTELFSPEIYYLSRLPAEINPTEVASVVLMALVLSFVATLYPSWRAARIDPVEALRYG